MSDVREITEIVFDEKAETTEVADKVVICSESVKNVCEAGKDFLKKTMKKKLSTVIE